MSAGEVVVRLVAEADTAAFTRMDKALKRLEVRHGMSVKGVRNLQKAFNSLGVGTRSLVKGFKMAQKSMKGVSAGWNENEDQHEKS